MAGFDTRVFAPPVILFFLKAPRAGYVKTRLARDVGASRALRIYRRLASAQLQRLPAEWPVEIHYTPRGARGEMQAWLGVRPGASFRLQRHGDLGARLAAAFARAFVRGPRRVLAIGGDCPGLDAARLRAAARALEHADVVLGPASDGGYYLVGLHHPAPGLFSDIPWGTPGVLRATRQRIRVAGLRLRLLDELEDVDDLASWQHATQSSAVPTSGGSSMLGFRRKSGLRAKRQR